MSIVVPAVLVDTKEKFDTELALINSLSSITRIQIDVVDGLFAEPPTWPYTAPSDLRSFVKAGQHLPHLDRFEYEIDLMCLDAEVAAEAWLALGASRLTFHAGSVPSLPQLLERARSRYGHIVAFGVALPVTADPALIEPCIGQLDYVQCMGIARIGRQGQPFDSRTLENVRRIKERYATLPVQVDGGLTLETAAKLVKLGVDHLVLGSAIARASEPAAVIAAFDDLANPYGF